MSINQLVLKPALVLPHKTSDVKLMTVKTNDVKLMTVGLNDIEPHYKETSMTVKLNHRPKFL
jgi:hypothetical protein